MLDFLQLSRALKHRLSLPLPGREAQLRMAHADRKINLARYKVPDDARKGAVLILFYEEDFHIQFPLILRQSGSGIHSGQISLPGGKFEEEDEQLVQTALREAEEEIHVDKHQVEILGALTDLYIPPSNFKVHPFVGITHSLPGFMPHPDEVVEILPMSVDELLNDSCIGVKEITLASGIKVVTPFYNLNSHAIWGATAMILSELKTILQEVSA